MTKLFTALVNDEAGFIVSAELILIATIGVLSLVVGLTEVASAINQELEDVASAFGSVNQTFCYRGLKGCSGHTVGSSFDDNIDACDEDDSITFTAPQAEWMGWSGMGGAD
jgi:Flp pilus assembly pilin Flp